MSACGDEPPFALWLVSGLDRTRDTTRTDGEI
jgi:hypothetical protein